MKKVYIFVVLFILFFGGLFLFLPQFQQKSIAKEFLIKNYSTSTMELSDDLEEMNDQINDVYRVYFTENALKSATANRLLAVADVSKSNKKIIQSSCKSIELNKTQNEYEYSYIVMLDVTLPDDDNNTIKCSGLIRFLNRNSKLIDEFYQLTTHDALSIDKVSALLAS